MAAGQKNGSPVHEHHRGRDADAPTQIPPRGWKDVLARTKTEVKQDRVPMLSAAVAFYSLLAIVPAMVAIVSLYGLLADPSDVDRQVGEWLGSAPQEVRDLIAAQLTSITENAGTAVGIGVVIGILVALWSASSGMAHLVEAINIVYDEEETRGWFKRRLLAILLTLGATIFIVVAVGLIAILPAVLAETGLGTATRVVANIVRWLVLLVGMVVALSVLYRYGPDRDDPKWRWTSPGAIAATIIWLLASVLFSVYTANFAKYNDTYGTLGAVVVVMLWLFLTALAVIVGAELNAELERQTRRDSTTGADRPMGARDAHAADTLGPTASEIRHKPAPK
ncbi:MAG TPA: YihY/virulence factor BrkB family protein [Acidimicrobiales bacterium]|nr:YihY/virulence factor BrkB family protein [Acidimicrobiales bacterium]